MVALVFGYALAGTHLAAATQVVVAPVHLLLGGLVGVLLWLGALGCPESRHGVGVGLRLAGAAVVVLAALAVGWSATPLSLSPSQTVAALGCAGLGGLALALGHPWSIPQAAGVLLLLLGGELLVVPPARDLDLVSGFAGVHLLMAATLGHFLRLRDDEGARPW